MQLFHCGKKTHNFGDFINPWFWEQCMPGVLDDDPREVVFGIGTILCSGKPMPAGTRRIHVLGSGYGYGDQPPDPRLQVWFVRGPRTAAKLHLEASRLSATRSAAAPPGLLPQPGHGTSLGVRPAHRIHVALRLGHALFPRGHSPD